MFQKSFKAYMYRPDNNKSRMFQNTKTYETGLSDFHKLVIRTMKLSYKKRLPRMMSIGTIKIFQLSILKIHCMKNLQIIPN